MLAAAVRANADVIVTADKTDFPEEALKPFDITAVSPDDFLMDQLDRYPGIVIECLRRQVQRNTLRRMSVHELLGRLARTGAAGFADQVRRHGI